MNTLQKQLARTGLALAAGISLILPINAASNPSEVAGAALFRDKGCAYCHGIKAQGTPKGPSLADVRKRLKPAQIANQINNGGQKMPAFEDSLSKDEVTQLVQFLRSRHRPDPPPLPAPPAVSGSVVNPAQ